MVFSFSDISPMAGIFFIELSWSVLALDVEQ